MTNATPIYVSTKLNYYYGDTTYVPKVQFDLLSNIFHNYYLITAAYCISLVILKRRHFGTL